MAKIGIIGAGSWGIALSVLLHNNGHTITVWSALPQEIEQLKAYHEHKEKLPGVKLAEDILFTTDLSNAVKEMDIFGACSTIFFYKGNRASYGGIRGKWTDYRQCGKRH